MHYRPLGITTNVPLSDVSNEFKADPSFKGKVYTLQEQIERAERGSKAVQAGNFYKLEDLLKGD
jgi:hypothetical protein